MTGVHLRPAWAGALALCVLLAVLHTWPLAAAPGTWSRNDNGDTQLNEWILAWVLHKLPRDPLHLFDANIFYPAPDALAFSEPLIVPALIAAPVWWAGGTAVLLYNVSLLAGFALSAFAGWWVVYRWTRDHAAGLLAGSMVAFNTHTLTRLAHVQGIHAWGLPLTLFAADRLVATARTRDALLLALWMTLMAYTSGYLVVFGVVIVAVVLLATIGEWRTRAVAVLGRFALAAVAAAIAILPVYIPYHRAAREQGMVRTLESVAQFSATLKGYLVSAGTLHYNTWSGRFYTTELDSFFPGLVVIVLAVLAIAGSARSGSPLRTRVVTLIALAVTGFVLSLGTRTPIYGWLFTVFPPMAGLRAAARFGNLFLLGMAMLAGLGLAWLRQRLGAKRGGMAIVLALILLANLEALRAPFRYVRFTGIPRVYSLLAEAPERVVLAEVPFYPGHAVFENAEYVLNSTAHWRPLMNGYSGYTPRSYRKVADAFWYFPRDYAVRAMKEAGVTHVMVHPRRYRHRADSMLAAVAERADLELMAVGDDGIRLYRFR